MNRFRADLHIHSRFSRATSKTLSLRQLAAWARVKGLALLGTGDFTHPGWLAEIEEVLAEGDDGLLRLKDPGGLAKELPWLADFPLPGDVRFMLQAELSLIYKRGGKVRKVHNLVFMPSLEAVKKFNARLAKVGNLTSDGRPILGLDSRHLLEMVLQTDPAAFLVPAHIWTPWFSLFGSKSGFDSIEECFGALAPEIFALETGLSSDPEMNWLLSALDRFRLISNSDAHSGEKLGREANLFAGELSYEGVFRALKHADGSGEFLGTVEFFPEEGKYHMDGHRACGVVLDPLESRARGGLCPVCGKPLTIGVLSRVRELADRDQPARPAAQPGFASLIPLSEILGEVLGCGPATKKAKELLARLLGRLGPELDILQDAAVEDVARHSRPLAEALARMRRGEVIRQPGYDGEFGRITLFSDQERRELTSGRSLVATAQNGPAAGKPGRPVKAGQPDPAAPGAVLPGEPGGLNARQREAVESRNHRLLVVAGPGTGKTHTLIARVRALLDAGVRPRTILAVTFTRRAAGELRSRLAGQAGEPAELPRADTLHALAFEQWTAATGQAPVLLSEQAARALFAEACPEFSGAKLKAAWNELELSRQRNVAPRPPRPAAAGHDAAEAGRQPAGESEVAPSLRLTDTTDQATGPGRPARRAAGALAGRRVPAAPVEPVPPVQELGPADWAERYAARKRASNLADYTDLLEYFLHGARAAAYVSPYAHILVDEIQDMTPLQLALIEALAEAPGAPGPLGKIGPLGVRVKQGASAKAGGPTGPTGLAGLAGASLFAIGDPNQSIYGFRGAAGDIEGWFAARFPGSRVIRLEENYRSFQPVLDLAGGLVPKRARLVSRRGAPGEPECEISLFSAPGLEGEVAWIADHARRLLGETSATLHKQTGAKSVSPGDIAVLVRFAGLIPAVERALQRRGVPCRSPQAEVFWNDPRAAMILASAGSLLGLGAAEGIRPAECPGEIVARGPRAVAAYLLDAAPFDALFWESRIFKDLCAAFEDQGGWAGLMSFVAERGEDELVEARSEKVQIMSLHAAKGLEFEAVFLPALEDGILPFAGPEFLTGKLPPPGAAPDENEERRLFYVGLTRAKSRLYLSCAAKRELYGRKLMLKPSRFLAQLPLDGIKRSTLVARKVRKEKQLDLFGEEA
jgi:uncharacterized protein (TIGR00375 family)